MGEMLEFSLTPVPLCLLDIDGSMQKTPKTSLLKELETRVITEAPSNIDTLVNDDMLVWLTSKVNFKEGMCSK